MLVIVFGCGCPLLPLGWVLVPSVQPLTAWKVSLVAGFDFQDAQLSLWSSAGITPSFPLCAVLEMQILLL